MYKKLRSLENAEDLTAQVFLEIIQSADRFDKTKSSESTWIYAISRNILNRYLRDAYTHSTILQSAFTEESLFSPDTIEEIVQKDVFVQALEELSEVKRNIIIMTFYHGLGPQEIAERLHLSYDNVCVLKSRTLKELKEKLTGEDTEDASCHKGSHF
jgi:RNA polymerase sigma-70 factor (ECF subfamily)